MVGSKSLPSLRCRWVEICLRFVPRLLAYHGTYRLPAGIIVGEMNAAVEAREPSLLCRRAERRE